jgi:hypothetical protein
VIARELVHAAGNAARATATTLQPDWNPMRASLFLVALCAAAMLLIRAPLHAQSATLLELSTSASGDRMVVDSAGGMVVRGTYGSGSIPASGGGTRLMWYPGKAAFRSGSVSGSSWDEANIGIYSTAMGYNAAASGEYSTAIGLTLTASGNYSTALGRHVSTNGMSGAFVYGDATGHLLSVMSATAANQFSVRAAGGYRLFTSSTLSAGVTLAAGGSTWSAVSDRARKEQFLAVDGEEVLARVRTLPITTWRYLAEEDRSTRHIGPMAQDWHAAFGFSADSLTINTGDLAGVNLAGVQALEARTRALAGRIHVLEGENAALREELSGIHARNTRLEARLDRLERAAGDHEAGARLRLSGVSLGRSGNAAAEQDGLSPDR